MPKKIERKIEPGLLRAIEIAGSGEVLARRLGITRQALQQWDKIPAKYLIPIERLTGVPREELRPELYRR